MSKNNKEVRSSLLAIVDLLKQLTEEVEELADNFYEDEEADEGDCEREEIRPMLWE